MHAIRVYVISFFSCCAAILNPKLNNNSFPIFGIFIHFFHSIHGISSLTPLNKNTVVTYIFSSVLLHRYRCDDRRNDKGIINSHTSGRYRGSNPGHGIQPNNFGILPVELGLHCKIDILVLKLN
uniref:Transmembrane protein n=1 Tax=Medicago truncatula TaxID=3880 RepID=Q2HV55_MEDTR|nr:hypothetical protein MtrDRAFT_AC148995g10v2 [Medicago truncatula]